VAVPLGNKSKEVEALCLLITLVTSENSVMCINVSINDTVDPVAILMSVDLMATGESKEDF